VKVGFYSPLPPARTGVADYAAGLLSALRNFGSVEIGSPGSINLYHLGNNQLHRPIYEQAIRNPGLVVLHDAVLHHFFLGALSREQYIQEFVYNYGEWSRDLASELWNGRSQSAADERYFRYPMIRRIAEVSRAIIVHNPGAAEIVRTHAPTAKIFEVPHFFVQPRLPSEDRVAEIREGYALRRGTMLFGIFGHLRESKRILPVLRAFEKMQAEVKNIALLLSGECVSSDMARAMEPYLNKPWVIRTGYLPEAAFWSHALAVNACINLRYPAAGESSGIAIRLMGIGKPVLVTNGPEVSRAPDAACLRVDTGLAEESMLSSYVRWLAQEPKAGIEIGSRAADYINLEHAVHRCASLYWEALQHPA
jgi:glycosyltransferase involved in cell wall biosynthesis